MQKHLPERVQKGQGTMRAFTFENATKIYFGGGCVKEHLLEAVKPYGETVMLAYGGGSGGRALRLHYGACIAGLSGQLQYRLL